MFSPTNSKKLLPVLCSQSRCCCTAPLSEPTRSVCRSFSVDLVSAAVVGNHYLWQDHLFLVCLCWTPGNWKTPSTDPGGSIRQLQIAVLLHFWAKLLCREGWTLKVMQPVSRSCTCAWHQSEKRKNFEVLYERSSRILQLISLLWGLWHLSPERW